MPSPAAPSHENAKALKFYEAFGFEVLAQTVAPIPHSHGVPMEQRMSLDLR